MRLECWERFPRHWFQRKLLVSDPGMHHGTCVTHVPWCMSGSLTPGGGENVPGIPGACAIRNFAYLARGPFNRFLILLGDWNNLPWVLWKQPDKSMQTRVAWGFSHHSTCESHISDLASMKLVQVYVMSITFTTRVDILCLFWQDYFSIQQQEPVLWTDIG